MAHRLRSLGHVALALAFFSIPVVSLRADDVTELHAAVAAARAAASEPGSEATPAPLDGWSPEKARAAARGVVRRSGESARQWTDAEILAAALLFTARGERELDSEQGSAAWFDEARDLVASVADEALRRRLQSRWTLALAALFNAHFDGRRSRDLLEAAVRERPEDVDVLEAAARLHEAIAERAFSGFGESVWPAEKTDAVRGDLVRALELFEHVLRLQPERARSRLRYGRVLLLVRRASAARLELEKLQSAAPDTDVPCLADLLLGAAWEQDGKLDQALATYRKAADEGSPQVARLAVARLQRREGDLVGAARSVEKLLGVDAERGDAWWRYQSEGIGPDNGHQRLFDSLWREARR